MVELVGGGSDINGATPSSFSVLVLLLASVKRFGVSLMRDFFICISSSGVLVFSEKKKSTYCVRSLLAPAQMLLRAALLRRGYDIRLY